MAYEGSGHLALGTSMPLRGRVRAGDASTANNKRESLVVVKFWHRVWVACPLLGPLPRLHSPFPFRTRLAGYH